MDRTATAPVEVRASVVAGLFLGGGELSMSISVVAMLTLIRKIDARYSNRAADRVVNARQCSVQYWCVAVNRVRRGWALPDSASLLTSVKKPRLCRYLGIQTQA